MTDSRNTAPALALALAALCAAGDASAANAKSTYPPSWCRVAAYDHCGATGACLPPPTSNNDPYTLNANRLEPEDSYPGALYASCPIIQQFRDQGAELRLDVVASQPTGYSALEDSVQCTVYSMGHYGNIVDSVFESTHAGNVDADNGTQSTHIMDLDGLLSTGRYSGSYNMWCSVPSAEGKPAASNLSFYRAREEATAGSTQRQFPASMCVPSGLNTVDGLRYYSNRASNVSAGELGVECPLAHRVGTSPPHQVRIYLNEASGGTATTCTLKGFYDWGGSPVTSITQTVSGSGDRYLSFSAPSAGYYSQHYTLDCDLSEGSSIYSYRNWY